MQLNGAKYRLSILTMMLTLFEAQIMMFKILLVEDNLIYRDILKCALLKRFIDIDTQEASGERDTLDAVDNYGPDLVVMDIHLEHGANGLDLTKRIKHDHPETVIVVLSQHDNPEYRNAARLNGANFFFSKSASLENIFEFVDHHIDRKKVSH